MYLKGLEKPVEQKAKEYAADQPFCVGDVSPMLEAAYLEGAREVFNRSCTNHFIGYAQGREDEKALNSKVEISRKASALILSLLALAILVPGMAFAQYEGYKGYQGYQGLQAPVIIAPQIGSQNERAYDRLLNEQSRNIQADTTLTRERIINERLGSNADNAVARSIVGSIVDSEVRARYGQ